VVFKPHIPRCTYSEIPSNSSKRSCGPEHYNKINLNRGISVLNNDFGTLTKQCHNRPHDKTKFSHLKDGDSTLLMNDRKKTHYATQYKNRMTITQVLICNSCDETMSKSDNRLQYWMNEYYWNNWKSLDGSGCGLIKPSAPNNAYAASQEDGFKSLTTQHTYQPIMTILV